MSLAFLCDERLLVLNSLLSSLILDDLLLKPLSCLFQNGLLPIVVIFKKLFDSNSYFFLLVLLVRIFL